MSAMSTSRRAQIRVLGNGSAARDQLARHEIPATIGHDNDDASVLLLVDSGDRDAALAVLGEDAHLDAEISTSHLIVYGDGLDAVDLLADHGIIAIPVGYDGEQTVLSVPDDQLDDALTTLGEDARPYEAPDITVPSDGTHIITYGDGIDAVDLLADHDINADVVDSDGHQTVIAVDDDDHDDALDILGMRARPAP